MIPLNAHVICIILQPLLFKLGRPSSCAPTPQACQWCFQNPRSWYVRPSPCLRTGRSYSQESKMLAFQCNAWLAAVLTTIEWQQNSAWSHCQSLVDNHVQLVIFQILAHHHLQHLSLEWRKLLQYQCDHRRKILPGDETIAVNVIYLESKPGTKKSSSRRECDRSVSKVFPSVFQIHQNGFQIYQNDFQIHQNGFRIMSKCFPDL